MNYSKVKSLTSKENLNFYKKVKIFLNNLLPKLKVSDILLRGSLIKKLKKCLARKIVKCYTINVKIKEQRK